MRTKRERERVCVCMCVCEREVRDKVSQELAKDVEEDEGKYIMYKERAREKIEGREKLMKKERYRRKLDRKRDNIVTECKR